MLFYILLATCQEVNRVQNANLYIQGIKNNETKHFSVLLSWYILARSL